MDITEIDFKELNEKQAHKLNKAFDHIKKKGNFAQTAIDEENLRRMLKLSPNICPCSVCATIKDRKNIESFSMPQMIAFKDKSFSDDNLRYIVAPFRHVNNEGFLASPLFGLVGRTITTLKNIIEYQYGKIKKFELKMDNTYGAHQQEIGEHGHIVVTFFKEEE